MQFVPGKGDCPCPRLLPSRASRISLVPPHPSESLPQKPRDFHRSGENTAPSKLPLQSSPPGGRCSGPLLFSLIPTPFFCPPPAPGPGSAQIQICACSGQLPGLDRALREELDYPSSLTPGPFSPGQQLQLLPSRSCTPSAWSSTVGLCLAVGLAPRRQLCRGPPAGWPPVSGCGCPPPTRPPAPHHAPGLHAAAGSVGAVGSPACIAPLPASLGHVSLPLEEREQRQLPVFQSCPPSPASLLVAYPCAHHSRPHSRSAASAPCSEQMRAWGGTGAGGGG